MSGPFKLDTGKDSYKDICMRLTAAQKHLLSESDAEIRSAERGGRGVDYINHLRRLGAISEKDIEIAALFGHMGAKEYQSGIGEPTPTWRNPAEIGTWLLTGDANTDSKIIPPLISLCGQAFTKVKGYIKKVRNQLDPSLQEKIDEFLPTLEEYFSVIRGQQEGGTPNISPSLMAALDGYGSISNWSYWGKISSHSGPGSSDHIRGKYGTHEYYDPNREALLHFRGSDYALSKKHTHPVETAIGSIASAMHDLDSMLINPSGALSISVFNDIIESLMPILGMRTIEGRLRKDLLPAELH